jgi:WD40 repeat protein
MANGIPRFLLSVAFLALAARAGLSQDPPTLPKPLFTLPQHSDGITAVTFSLDGRRMATASNRYRIRVWDVPAGRNVLTLNGHTDWVRDLAFSPDGKLLASASDDKTAKVWDISKGKELLTFRGHTELVYRVAFSPDGRQIVSGGRHQPIKVWEATTGKELLSFAEHLHKPEPLLLETTSLAFSPEGKRILSATSFPDRKFQWGDVKVWDAVTGKEALSLPGAADYVALSPDGRRLAAIDWDGLGI